MSKKQREISYREHSLIHSWLSQRKNLSSRVRPEVGMVSQREMESSRLKAGDFSASSLAMLRQRMAVF